MEEFESLPEFQALAVAAAGKPERSMGDSVIPAEPPQWSDVRNLAQNLAKDHSAQLALHVYMIQAETHVKGFVGFQSSLAAVRDLLQNEWDGMYPSPDLDDPDDMYYARVNLMNELSEQPAFLDGIHRLPLVGVRGIGEFSTRDIEISAGIITGSDEDLARCQEGLIRGAFAESDKEQLATLAAALNDLPDLCSNIENLFGEKTGQPAVLSLGRLRDRVTACRARFHEFAQEYLEAEPQATMESDSLEGSEKPSDDKPAQPLKASSLSDKSMVLDSFDAILRYYQLHEPSSPVRILTISARGFVNQSFFEILQSLAPLYREELPTLLIELQKQPLAALLSDSYTRFLGGENLAVEIEVTNDSGNSHQQRVISSRDEVLEVLQDIETYFISNEPASPIPLIIADIRKLVPKRFSELISEFSRLLPQPLSESGE